LSLIQHSLVIKSKLYIYIYVSEKLVRDWRKQKKYLFERMKRAKHYGVSPYIKLETALNDWVLEYRIMDTSSPE